MTARSRHVNYCEQTQVSYRLKDPPSDLNMEWPDVINSRWLAELPTEARTSTLYAIVEVLISRPIEWWEGYGWALTLVDEARRTERDERTKESATVILEALLVPFKDSPDGNWWSWGDGYKTLGYIRKGLAKQRRSQLWSAGAIKYRKRIKEWIEAYENGPYIFPNLLEGEDTPPSESSEDRS